MRGSGVGRAKSFKGNDRITGGYILFEGVVSEEDGYELGDADRHCVRGIEMKLEES